MVRRRDAGQVLLFVILALPVILGMLGLAVDIGYFRYTKRRMQLAADSVALAGAASATLGARAVAWTGEGARSCDVALDLPTGTSEPWGLRHSGKVLSC